MNKNWLSILDDLINIISINREYKEIAINYIQRVGKETLTENNQRLLDIYANTIINNFPRNTLLTSLREKKMKESDKVCDGIVDEIEGNNVYARIYSYEDKEEYIAEMEKSKFPSWVETGHLFYIDNNGEVHIYTKTVTKEDLKRAKEEADILINYFNIENKEL